MIKVFLEFKTHSELVAVFADNDSHLACYIGLLRLAKLKKATLTEVEINIADLSLLDVMLISEGKPQSKQAKRVTMARALSYLISDTDVVKALDNLLNAEGDSPADAVVTLWEPLENEDWTVDELLNLIRL